MTAHVEERPEASLAAMFSVSVKIGLLSFGGGLSAWYYREFVERRGWISDDDFSSSLAIAQMLPGANVVNLVVCMGEQLRGPIGALTCIFGFLVGPFFAVIGLSVLVDQIPNANLLQIALGGVAAAAMGLILSMCWRGVRRAARHWPSLIVIFSVAIGVGVMQWPLLLVVAVVAPISIGLSWYRYSIHA